MLDLGVSPSKIVYSNVAKEEGHILYAKKSGVLLTTADTIDEVLKIKLLAPEMKILWRLSIKEENPEMMKTLFSGKFGDDLVSIEQAS
jgi:diaminopimelate decarboxylase